MNDRPTNQPALKTLDLFVCRTARECWPQRPAQDGCVWFVMQGAPPGHTAFIFQLRPTSWFFFFFSLSLLLRLPEGLACCFISESLWVSARERLFLTHKPHSHTVGSAFSVGVGSILKDDALNSVWAYVCVCVCISYKYKAEPGTCSGCVDSLNILQHTHAAKMLGVVKIRETDIPPIYQSIIPFFLSRNETKERETEKEKKKKRKRWLQIVWWIKGQG